jgi:homospermidine synthase
LVEDLKKMKNQYGKFAFAILMLGFMSFSNFTFAALTEDKLNQIDEKVNAMSPSELYQTRATLKKEQKLLESKLELSSNQEESDMITSRLDEITAELSSVQ